MLRARGFNVRRLEDGLPEWRAAGLPVDMGSESNHGHNVDRRSRRRTPAASAGTLLMTYSNPAAYEQSMGRWSARLAPLFTRFAGVRDGQRFLDVGCGTGSLSRTLLAAGKAVSVVGVDPPKTMSRSRGKGRCLPRDIPSERRGVRYHSQRVLRCSDGASRSCRNSTIPVAPCERWRERPAGAGPSRRACGTFGMACRCFRCFGKRPRPRHRRPRPAAGPSSHQADWGFWHWPNFGQAPVLEVRTAGLELTQEFGSFEDFWLPFLAEATPTSKFAIGVNRETRGELANALRRIFPKARPDGSFALPARALAVAGIAGH